MNMNNSIASLSLKTRGGGLRQAPTEPFPTLGSSLTNQFCQIASIYNNNAIVGLYGGVGTYYSTDYGKTYAQSTGISGIGTAVILGVSLYGLRAIAHTATLVFYSSNAGQSWTQVATANLPGVSGSRNYQGCAIYDNYAIIADSGRIYVSANYGLNWSTITITNMNFRQPAISFNSANNQYIAVCSTSNNTMYYCTNFTGVSSNTFTRCATGLLQAVGVALVGLKGIAGSFFSYRGFWYTVDGGVNWIKSASLTNIQSYSLGLSENGVGIADGTNATSYYVTKDFGLTWTTGSLTGIDVVAIHNNNAIAFALGNPSRAHYGKLTL